MNNNNVYNANFAPRPALMEYRVQVARRRKQRTIIKGGYIPSSVDMNTGDKHMAPTLPGSLPGKAPDTSGGGRYWPLSAMPDLRSTIRKPSKDV